MRISYVCNWKGESGGIKTLYDHVRLLVAQGRDARLAAYGRFQRCSWFASDERATPAVDDLLADLRPDDLVVLPDIAMRDDELRSARCRQVVFVQNPDLITGPVDDPRYEALLVPSRPLVPWVRDETGYRGPIHVVPGLLEAEHVGDGRRRQVGPPRLLIIDRPDKHRGEPSLAAQSLRAAGWEVTCAAERVPRAAFLRRFEEHDLYLHLSYREGFPVSVLEAFGRGCLVVGFAGRGGLEFMRDGHNCRVVADGDWRAAVARAQALLAGPADRRASLRRHGVASARSYPPGRTSRALTRALDALQSARREALLRS